MHSPIVSCVNVYKSFTEGDSVVDVLRGVSFEVKAGTRVGIRGSSGSGKSTLLHIMGALDMPTRGDVCIEGVPITRGTDMHKLRSQVMGFVYQHHYLLNEFSALENIMLPALIAGQRGREVKLRARNLLNEVGLSAREDHFPSMLSGGEKQRISIARAFMQRPKIVFADEPTGSLDEITAQNVLDLFMTMVERYNMSFIIASHDKELLSSMDRVYTLSQGCLSSSSS